MGLKNPEILEKILFEMYNQAIMVRDYYINEAQVDESFQTMTGRLR